MSNERSLLTRLTRGLPSDAPHVHVGVGDDCAVTQSCGAHVRLCTTDLLIEGVHFRRQTISPGALGQKSLAVNLSDIAAMGGRPLDAYVSLALPQDIDASYVDALVAGIGDLARLHDVVILGGDTTRSWGPLVINVAIIGEADKDTLLLRSGARPGDTLFVSGPLGDSAAGLNALEVGHADALARQLIARHQSPHPRLALGRALAQSGLAHAAIDLSDGLSTDLGHLLDRSEVSARVDLDAIPLSEGLQRYCAREAYDATRFTLDGGEDYELLIAGEAALSERFAELHPIGEITAASKAPSATLQRPDGSTTRLDPRGWDPFRSKT